MPPAYKEDTVELTEQSQVILHRFTEARLYGFTRIEARLFAESDISVSGLRRLKKAGCPPAVAARIIL